MYRIEFDEARILLTLTLEGYWTVAEFRTYEAELLATVAKIRRRHKSYRTLSQTSRYPVQSAEVAEAFARSSAQVFGENPGPFAIIVGSMLNKKQAERVFNYPHVRVFLDEAEAREWIFEEYALPG